MMAPCHCLQGLSKLSQPGGKCIAASVSFENTSRSQIQLCPPAVCTRSHLHTMGCWVESLHLMGLREVGEEQSRWCCPVPHRHVLHSLTFIRAELTLHSIVLLIRVDRMWAFDQTSMLFGHIWVDTGETSQAFPHYRDTHGHLIPSGGSLCKIISAAV